MAIMQNLNNIAQSGWDYINNVAKNITVENLQSGWNKYMVRGEEELAKAVSKTQTKKVSAFDFITTDKLEDIYKGMDKTEDVSSAYRDLTSALKAKNLTEAKDIAEKRFQDSKFLEYLMDAEKLKMERVNAMSSAKPNMILGSQIESTKEKIDNFSVFGYKPGEALLTDNQREKIARGVMKTKGNYFDSGDTKTNQIRMGVVGGAYMGAATIGRITQGGSPVTNEYGERDIVGIPFI